jgi:hypothetical protein
VAGCNPPCVRFVFSVSAVRSLFILQILLLPKIKWSFLAMYLHGLCKGRALKQYKCTMIDLDGLRYHSKARSKSSQCTLLTLKFASSQHTSEGLGCLRGLTRLATQQETKRNRPNRSRDQLGRYRTRSRPKRLPNRSRKDPSGRSTWRIS